MQEKRQENLINDGSQSISEAHPNYYSVGTGGSFAGVKWPGCQVDHSFCIVVRLKMIGSLLLLPVHTFMA
jgi:hypothetical protein